MAGPQIFRVMRKGDDDRPVVEATGKGLGVRHVPINGLADIDLDESGRVLLNDKGMSVAPAWRQLPYFLIPKRLKDKAPKARAARDFYCFTMGERPFQDGVVADGLLLKQDRPTHGLVVPEQSVSLDQYQADLAATRNEWVIDEA